MIDRILKRGVYGYDPNSLHLFERALLSSIEQLPSHNILFISLQAQLKSILSLKTERFGGVPDWFYRDYRNGCIVLKQQRFVGADKGPPPIEPPPSFCFEISHSGEPVGKLQLNVDEAIREIIIEFFSGAAEYPTTIDPIKTLGTVGIDEREYWRARLDWLRPISELVAEAVDKGRFSDNVIVCNPKGVLTDSLFGVGLCSTYQNLLKFCDGIRVNDLVVTGSAAKPHRLFNEEGKKYLDVGRDQKYSYAYQVADERTTDEVIRFQHQVDSPQESGMTLIELLKSALN